MRELLVFFIVLLAMCLVIPASAADHSIQWQNHCSYPVWVAIQGGEQHTIKGIPPGPDPIGKDKTYGGCSCMFDATQTKAIGCNPTTRCDGLACAGPNGEGNFFKCDQGTPLVDGGGFKLDAKTGTHTSTVVRNWQGAFWGRTGCTGSDDDLDCGYQTCRVYTDGKGKTQCAGQGITPPATKGEINFDENGLDTYDVSIVDGFNVPMLIELVPGTGQKVPLDAKHAKFDCGEAGTKTNLLPLFNATGLNFDRLVKISNGKMTAIWSACSAASPPNPLDPRWKEYCCKPPWGPVQDYTINGNTKCDPTTWPADMNTAKFFHDYLIGSYSYAYDDDASTFQCKNADENTLTSYMVTFCGDNEPDRISLPGRTDHMHISEIQPTPTPVVTPVPTSTPLPAQTPVPAGRYNPASSGEPNF